MTRSKKSGNRPKHKEFVFEAIGTRWSIEYASGVDRSRSIETMVRQRIDAFDKVYSRFRDDSLVSRIAQQAGTYELPVDAAPLLDFYATLYAQTNGAVNPLVGKTLSDAGYDAEYSLKFKKKTIAPSLPDAIDIADGKIVAREPVLIDVGAAGKGYLVDLICDLLRKQGISHAVVNAGGDIRVFSEGSTPSIIALEHPEDRSQAIGTATISNVSLCGSAVTLRKWGVYHHVIDPRTASSPTHILAVWVVAGTAMVADGISTALFFTDPAHLLKTFTFEYAIIHKDYSLQYSKDFPAQFFAEEEDN